MPKGYPTIYKKENDHYNDRYQCMYYVKPKSCMANKRHMIHCQSCIKFQRVTFKYDEDILRL